MTPLTLCWLTIPNATPIEVIRAAAAGSFSSAAIKVVDAGETDISIIGENRGLVPSLKRSSAEEGITLTRAAGFRLDGRPMSDRYLPYVEAGAELGVKYISIIGTDLDEGRLTAHFADLCDCAAQFGLQTTIEFVPSTSVKTVEDAHDLIRRSGKTNATILVDTMHVHRSGGTAGNLRRVPADLLSVVQLCDGKLVSPEPSKLMLESRNDRLDPGMGELPLVAMLEALPADIPIEIEVPCMAFRNTSPTERAIAAANAARAFLDDFARRNGAVRAERRQR